MKSKILLAVFILFIFTVPSRAEITKVTLCQIKQGKISLISADQSSAFIQMIENPQAEDKWTDCRYVVGLWNYWEHYATYRGDYSKAKKQLPKYAIREKIPAEKAKGLIERIGEIANFMYKKGYNKNDARVERYFHYLTQINNACCEITKTCGGKTYTWGSNGDMVIERNDNKQPQKGVAPEEVVAEAAKKVQEMGGSGDGMGTGHGSGKGGFSWSSMRYFRQQQY